MKFANRYRKQYLRQWCKLHGVQFNRYVWIVRRTYNIP